MKFFKGPKRTCKNYISYVVIPDCSDYFDLLREALEREQEDMLDEYKAFRYFLNALRSLDKIPDYFFYEHEEYLYAKSADDFRKEVFEIIPEIKEIDWLLKLYEGLTLRDLEQVERGRTEGIELLETFLDKDELLKGPRLNAELFLQKQDEILSKAFKLWILYVNGRENPFSLWENNF